MDATRMLAVIVISLVASAGSFAVPSSLKVGDSCFERCPMGYATRGGGVGRQRPARCRREQQRHHHHNHHHHHRRERSPPLLFSPSSHLHAADQQRRHRFAGWECPPTATATATRAGRTMTNMCTASSSSSSSSSSSGGGGREAGEEGARQQAGSPQQQSRRPGRGQQTRADFLRAGSSLAGFAAMVLGGQKQEAQAIDLGGVEFGFKVKDTFEIPEEDNPDGLRSPRPLAYRVEFTDPPTTVPFPRDTEPNLVKEMSGWELVFFGVHGDDPKDPLLAAKVMGKISDRLRNNAAIGLEQVEMQFQPALDAYIAGGQGDGEELDGADAELEKATQWNERCAFPFENFLPMFHLARRRGLPLVAMGVDSEKVFDVMQNGMDSLGEDERNAYVSDFKGFVTYVRDKGFQVYADRLIFPSYDRLKDAGLLGSKPPTKPNFFAARILADEALASKAVDWASNNKGTKLFVVQREDHVKFGFGASGRAARIAKSLGNEMSTKSVLINPTAEDSLSLSRSLRLALEYADDLQNGKPLANYLWFSKSPKVNQIPRMVNPEDKGWLEKVNLYDFKGAAAS